MTKLFSYDVTYSPDPAPANIGVTLSDTAVTATVSGVPSFNFSLHASGNFVQKILSTILEPIAGLIAGKAKDKPADALNGVTDKVATIGSYSVDGIVITPESLALGSFGTGSTAMVQISGTLKLTPQS